MNLNDIKGVIEIKGESYDPKEVLKALLAQGLKIHPLNGSLLVGRTFIDPSPNIQTKASTCPISDHCKIYDRLGDELKNDEDEEFSSYDLDRDSSSNRTYVDPLDIDMENYNVKDLFSEQSYRTSSAQIDSIDNETLLEDDFDNDFSQEPTEMIGMSPVTRYGVSSNIDLSDIPAKYRGKCPNCKSIINVRWKYCGRCGSVMG